MASRLQPTRPLLRQSRQAIHKSISYMQAGPAFVQGLAVIDGYQKGCPSIAHPLRRGLRLQWPQQPANVLSHSMQCEWIPRFRFAGGRYQYWAWPLESPASLCRFPIDQKSRAASISLVQIAGAMTRSPV